MPTVPPCGPTDGDLAYGDVAPDIASASRPTAGQAASPDALCPREPSDARRPRRGGPVSCAVLVVTVLIASAAGAYAQNEPGDVGGFTRLGSFPAFLPFEHLDTQNVQVMLRFTALVLPGHRGRNLVIEYGPMSAHASVWWGIAACRSRSMTGRIPDTTPAPTRTASTP
jgi:hypothetical protein